MLHDAQRFCIAEGQGFRAGPAWNQSKIENMKYKLKQKAKLKPSCRTEADSELQPMLQCQALTFGNALLVAVV